MTCRCPVLLLALSVLAAADMDLDLVDAPVSAALLEIGTKGEFGVAFSADQLVGVDGRPLRVTIRAEDLEPLQALHVVARAAGLQVEDQGEGVYVVRPTTPIGCRCHIAPPVSCRCAGQGADPGTDRAEPGTIREARP